MDKELQEKLFTAIEGLARKMGTTSEKLYVVLIKQAKVDAFSSLFMLALVIINAYCSISFNINHCNDSWYTITFPSIQKKDVDVGGILSIAWMGFSVIGGSIYAFISGISTILTGIFNPEYNAVSTVINIIGAKTTTTI